MNAAIPQSEILLFPLSSLVASQRNVRKKASSSESIEQLAESIKNVGLIQNLTVVPSPKSGKYEVIAGGRRLQALKLLQQQKAITKDYDVLCHVVTIEQAVEMSLVENMMREAMHPADEFDAFKALADDGATAEQIAERFGMEPKHVVQRLKLANVAPDLFARYREGKANLDQMKALALTDDHDKQRAAFGKGNGDWLIRKALTEGQVPSDDKRVRYVTVAAYEKHGGAVARDLFAERGGNEYITDVALLNSLVEAKLERAAAKLRKEGWGWVEAMVTCDYATLHSFSRLDALRRDLTADEAAELEQLNAEHDELGHDEEYDEDAANRIEQRINEIEDGLKVEPTDEQKAEAGAIVHIDYNGNAVYERGLLKPQARKALAASGLSVGGKEKVKNDVSDALCMKLTKARTEALRAALIPNTAVALVAVTHALALNVFHRYDAASCTTIDVKLDNVLAGRGDDEGEPETKAGAVIRAKREEIEAMLPKEPGAMFAWLLEQEQAVVLDILAFCASTGVNAVLQRESNDKTYSQRGIAASRELGAAIGFDMSQWWEATESNYLGHVSKAKVSEAVAAVAGEADAAAVAKLPKSQAVSEAQAKLAGSGWVPSLIR